MKLNTLSVLFLAFCASIASANGLNYTLEGGKLSGPPTIATSGYVELSFQNASKQSLGLQLVRLRPGKTFEQYKVALADVMGVFAKGSSIAAQLKTFYATGDSIGGLEAEAGARASAGVLLEPGTYVATVNHECPFCPGTPQSVVLKVSQATPVKAPTPDLKVNMADFQFQGLPNEVRSGMLLWEVANTGQQGHVLVVFKLGKGKTVKDLQAYFSDPKNPPGPPPAEYGSHLTASAFLSGQQRSFHSFDLQAGQYAVICYVPETATGVPHHLMGMVQALTVK